MIRPTDLIYPWYTLTMSWDKRETPKHYEAHLLKCYSTYALFEVQMKDNPLAQKYLMCVNYSDIGNGVELC